MRERVDQLVGFGAESIWVSTFHSTCVRILRRLSLIHICSGWIVAAQAGKDAVMGSFYTTGQYILIFLTGSFLVLVYLFSSLAKRVSRSEGLLRCV